jgi:hypothetical protein
VGRNHTLRVESHSVGGDCTLRVEFNLVRVEITLVRFKIILLRVVIADLFFIQIFIQEFLKIIKFGKGNFA